MLDQGTPDSLKNYTVVYEWFDGDMWETEEQIVPLVQDEFAAAMIAGFLLAQHMQDVRNVRVEEA